MLGVATTLRRGASQPATGEEEEGYKLRKPHVFFDTLRDGYLLSKIAMVAVPANAQFFRNDVCHDAATR